MTSLPDLGTDIMASMRSVVAARRTPAAEMSMWQKATTMFSKKELPRCLHYSLTTLALQGFQPQDFIEHNIPWRSIQHPIDATIDFGFEWSHMIAMQFEPHHFKSMEWRHFQQLKIGAMEMLQSSLRIHDLVALELTPQQLHQLGWTWDLLTSIGATTDNISISPQDIRIYFGKTTPPPKLVVKRKTTKFNFG